MAVQEIIIYRNPAEKAMWDAWQDGSAFGDLLTLVIAISVVLFIVAFAHRVYENWKMRRKINKRRW